MSIKFSLPPGHRAAPDLLAGQRILITGANRGLGQAIALACAAAGAITLLLGRDVRALEKLADGIEAAGGHEPVIIPLNLEGATQENYEEVAELLAARYDALEGLVLNAGMLGELSPFRTSDPVLWARVFQVNVHASYLLTRALLPQLERARRSTILGVSSGVGRHGRAYWGAYAASKFALEGMLQVLADEAAGVTGVEVVSVNPGRCHTRMRAQAYPAEDVATLPEPESLAPAFVHLLAGAAREFHGRQLDLQ